MNFWVFRGIYRELEESWVKLLLEFEPAIIRWGVGLNSKIIIAGVLAVAMAMVVAAIAFGQFASPDFSPTPEEVTASTAEVQRSPASLMDTTQAEAAEFPTENTADGKNESNIQAKKSLTEVEPKDEVEASHPAENEDVTLKPVILDQIRGLAHRIEVVDQHGNPVKNAFIDCRMTLEWVRHYHQGTQLFSEKTQVGQDGVWTLTAPSTGWLHFEARQELFQTKTSLNHPAGQDVRIVLDTGSMLTGEIVDAEAGSPVEKSWVKLNSVGNQGKSHSENVEKGRLKFIGLSPGPYKMIVTASDYAEQVLTLELLPGENTLRIELKKGKTQSFLLLSQENKPLPGIKAEATVKTDGNVEWRSESYLSDAEGRFKIGGLGGKKYIVDIKFEKFAAMEHPFQFHDGDEILRPKLAARMILKVTDAEGKRSNQVQVKNEDYQKQNWRVFEPLTRLKFDVVEDAHIAEGITPGHYVFSVSAEGHKISEVQRLEFLPGESRQLEIQLEKASLLKLQLLGLDANQPAPAELEVRFNLQGHRVGQRFKKNETSGWYEDYLQKPYESLSVHVPNFLPVEIKLPNPLPEPLLIQLERGRLMTLRVENESGLPVVNATVRIIGNSFSFEGPTLLENSMEIGGLDTGEYVIRVSHADYAEHEGRFSLTPDPASLTHKVVMVKGSSLSGRVLDPAGQPASGAEVALMVRQPRGDYSPMVTPGVGNAKVITDKEGNFRFNRLGANEYRLSASAAQGIANSQPLLLQREDIQGVELRLVPGLELSGGVEDEDGKTLSGVQVQHHRLAGPSFQTFNPSQPQETDTAGRFKITNLDEGQYRLNFNRDGYQTHQQITRTGQRDLKIVLKSQRYLRGVVKWPTGEIAQQYQLTAKIFPMGQTTNVEEKERSDQGFTIAYPNQRNWGQAASHFKIIAQAEGYSPGYSEEIRMVNTDNVHVEIFLTLERRLQLRIVDASGQPLSGAQADLVSMNRLNMNANRQHGSTETSQSDPAGMLVLVGLPEGPVDILVRAPGHVHQYVEQLSESGVGASREIRMSRGGRLVGTVKDDSGQLVMGAEVMLNPGDPTLARLQSQSSTTSLADGSYILETLPAGSWKVSHKVKKGNQNDRFLPNTQSELVYIEDGKTVTLNLGGPSDKPQGSLSGSVTGSRLGDVQQLLLLPVGGQWQDVKASAGMNVDGKFDFGRVPVGSYLLTAFGMNLMLRKQVDIREAQHLEVELSTAGASISGRVNRASGEPLAIGQAMLYPVGLFSGDLMTAMNQVSAYGIVTAGQFSIEPVPAGAYDLLINPQLLQDAEMEGVSTLVKNLNVGEGQKLDLGEIRLEKGVSLLVNVLTPEGLPAAGAMVAINGGMSLGHGMLQTDAEGRVRTSVPNRFPMRVDAFLRGYAIRRVETQVPEVTLRLNRGGDVHLRLKGDPIRGRKIRLFDTEGQPQKIALDQPLNLIQTGVINTDARGEAIVKNISPGTYTLKVVDSKNMSQFESESRPFEVFAGTEVMVDIEILTTTQP